MGGETVHTAYAVIVRMVFPRNSSLKSGLFSGQGAVFMGKKNLYAASSRDRDVAQPGKAQHALHGRMDRMHLIKSRPRIWK